jgi:hypothetical protein
MLIAPRNVPNFAAANSLESADNRAIVVFVSSDLDLAKDHRF